MRLGLCSGALPDATFPELIGAAFRRGLSALELRAGDAHRVDPARPLESAATAEHARDPGVEVVAFRATRTTEPLRLARLGEILDLPILLDGPEGLDTRLQRACQVAAQGTPVAVVVRGPDVLRQARAVWNHDEHLELAWDAEPESASPGPTAAALLNEVGPRLRHIRLQGGGPEAALQEGRGIGEMAGRLALAGYDGTLILTPSSPRYRIAWQTWLGRRGGWGCGSKAPDPELVTITGPQS